MNIDREHIFKIKTEAQFNELALEVFNFQMRNIPVYQEFVQHLNPNWSSIKTYKVIPFLPIEFFKTHELIAPNKTAEIIFSSSGTTGTSTSKHFVQDVSYYENSYQQSFELFYGFASECCFLALLPNYLEREGSSLIYMIDDLIKISQHPESSFLLYDHELLFNKLEKLKKQNQKTVLIGVTYALLDFIEAYQIHFPELIIMETGGMKGRRKEMIREELHQKLCNGFGVKHIHSEYGMTELLSQAYSKGNGIFECPPWMKVMIRDVNDPLTYLEQQKTGGINVIDLANINSCSFIATQDLGKCYNDNTFEVLGRFDNSDIRGCNLLIS
ncbi:acyl transferase [Pedobacter glucosidilyticus]|uniref:acyl transferase n=1 Tax=Pedobacter glucosidilyticus TaxID=1122941 RepID=UPI0026F0BD4E|nr:acyl transferase [Pedobacter glucosidilyticus]